MEGGGIDLTTHTCRIRLYSVNCQPKRQHDDEPMTAWHAKSNIKCFVCFVWVRFAVGWCEAKWNTHKHKVLYVFFYCSKKDSSSFLFTVLSGWIELKICVTRYAVCCVPCKYTCEPSLESHRWMEKYLQRLMHCLPTAPKIYTHTVRVIIAATHSR